MQRRRSIIFGVLLCAMICFLAFPAAVFAEPGEGDGGGGGPVIPLRIDWTYPVNGESNVSVTPVIQCKFSHNVALSAVMERNARMFLLAKLDGAYVDVNVYAADSQLEFAKRQYVYIEPVKPLEYNTTYVVTAREGIQAKNSMVTDVDQSFQFTTCGRRTDFNESKVSLLGQAGGGNTAETAAGTYTGKKEGMKNGDGPDAASLPETQPGDEAAGEGETNRAGAVTAGFVPENLHLAHVTWLGAGFLLFLSIVIPMNRAKRRKQPVAVIKP